MDAAVRELLESLFRSAVAAVCIVFHIVQPAEYGKTPAAPLCVLYEVTHDLIGKPGAIPDQVRNRLVPIML